MKMALVTYEQLGFFLVLEKMVYKELIWWTLICVHFKQIFILQIFFIELFKG